jgi:hypothetical protein
MIHRNVTAATLLAASLFALFALAARAEAHHSFAMFDKKKFTTLRGTISKVEWMNPHAYLFLNVAGEGGTSRQYAIECSSPNELKRFGWKKNSVKVGDAVTVEIYPLRDGRPGGLLYALTLPDGVVLKAN